MNKLYAVHAYEQIFGGHHGMEICAVYEVPDEQCVIGIAENLSSSIIEDYSSVMDFLTKEANDEYSCLGYVIEEEENYSNDSNYTAILDRLIDDDIAYDIYPIRENCNKDVTELDHLINLDPKGFIREYCEDMM